MSIDSQTAFPVQVAKESVSCVVMLRLLCESARGKGLAGKNVSEIQSNLVISNLDNSNFCL